MPGILPGRSFRRTDRVSRLLFHWRADELSLQALTGQLLSVSRASVGSAIDRAGSTWTRVHSQPRFEMFDADGDGIRERASLLIDGKEANRVIWSDDFSQWTQILTPTRVANAIDLGKVQLSLLGDDDAAATNIEGFRLPSTLFSIDTSGATPFSIHVSKGPTPATTDARIFLTDDTAGIRRLDFGLTWNGTVPVITMMAGTLVRAEAVGKLAYRLQLQTTALVFGNSHRIDIQPASGSTDTGNVYVGGVMVGDPNVAATRHPTSHIPTTGSLVTREQETVKAIGFGPDMENVTIYLELARPVWTQIIPNYFPSLLSIGSNFALDVYATSVGDRIRAEIRSPSIISVESGLVPANPLLNFCAQFRNLKTGGSCRIDVNNGAGFTAWSTAVSGATVFGSQEVNFGFGSNTGRGHVGLALIKIAEGLYEPDQMRGML